MEFKLDTIQYGYDLSEYALNLHYPEWDTEGREESDIPKRTERYKKYILKEIAINDIIEPGYEIDEDKVDEYSQSNFNTMPPIILSKKIKGKYPIIDGCHRYFAATSKNKTFIFAFVPAKN